MGKLDLINIALNTTSIPSNPNPTMREGFETHIPADSPASQPFRTSVEYGTVTVENTQAIEGTKSLRSHVLNADPGGQKHRAEIQHKGGGDITPDGEQIPPNQTKFTTRAFGWSMFIPNSWVYDPTATHIFMQWKNLTDPGDSGNPPLSLRITNDNIQYNFAWNEDNPHSGAAPPGPIFGELNSGFTRGVWHKFVIEIHYDYRHTGGNGYVKMWYKEDGDIHPTTDLIVDYNGPIGFNDAVGPFLKLGLYPGDEWDTQAERDASAAEGVTEIEAFYDQVFISEGPWIESNPPGGITYTLDEQWDNWSGDNPVGWTVGGEGGANQVTENPAGSLQLISDGSLVTCTRNGVLTTQRDYNYEIKVDRAGAGSGIGSVRVNAVGGTTVTIHLSDAEGILTGTFNSGDNTNVQIKRHSSGNTSFTIDYLRIWESEQSEQIAFPGAEGHGKYTVGGRVSGTEIKIVSNYDELQTAVKDPDPSIILFDTSGVYTLTSGNMSCDVSNKTILGHSAPSPGVILSGQGVSIQKSEHIWRGITISRGRNGSGSSGDALAIGTGAGTAVNNIIIDHVDVRGADDGGVDLNFRDHGGGNVTLQEVAIYFATDGAAGASLLNHPTTGFLVQDVTYYRVFFAHTGVRNPLVQESIRAEVINTVGIYYGSRSIDIDGGIANVVGNYVKDSPSGNADRAMQYFETAAGVSGIYIDGNITPTRANDTLADNLCLWEDSRTENGIYWPGNGSAFPSNFDLSTIQSGDLIEASVLASAGNFYQDSEHARIISEYNAGNDRISYSLSTLPLEPSLAVNTVDHEVNYTAWANANGFGSQNNLFNDGSTIVTYQGYTMSLVEHYAESLIPPAV